jgi:hypothetical protein|tara:strand:- start:122 stop:433 length:312 start_codon:yes stop_codon:yes gene_type:complete
MEVTPLKNMEEAVETFNSRSGYGRTFKQYGEVMQALFPEGLPKIDQLSEFGRKEEINRMGNFTMIVYKLMRYCNQWDKMHKDSIHDLGVYAFIQEAIDDSIKG